MREEILTVLRDAVARAKAAVHEATKDPLEKAVMDSLAEFHKYSTSKRTEPITLEMELALIPRLPAKPVDCTDAEFEDAMNAVRHVWRQGKPPSGKFIWYPRQRELFVEFPPEEIHTF